MTNKAEFGWPPRELSPNARTHWRKKAPITKAYKQACWAEAKNSGLKLPEGATQYHLWIDFYPPDKRRRDDDNLIASFKAGRDGIAAALGIDDVHFVTHCFVQSIVKTGGMVRVKISGGPDDFHRADGKVSGGDE